MGAEGFKKAAPVEPFKRSTGLKAVLSQSTSDYLMELKKYNMVIADVILESDKNEKIALRAKVNNNDLRFGYFFTIVELEKTQEKTQFRLRWQFVLVYLVLLAAVFSIAKDLYELIGFWSLLILVPITIVPLGLAMRGVKSSLSTSFSIYSKIRRKRKEIDQLVAEIGNSMGGKQITPVKRTTVELED
jgi:hypothetical protein